MIRTIACLLPAMFMASASGAEPPKANPSAFVWLLTTDDMEVRARAKTRLIELESDAVEALVRATCGDPSPDRELVSAALSILAYWEEQSWTDPDCEAAIDKFVQMVRDPKNCVRENLPLSPDARYPFAETVRVLDVAPDDAAAYLRNRGAKTSVSSRGYYSSVRLPRDWLPEPKDWLYIANLAREIPRTPYVNGTRHPISIDISGPIEGDTLVECLKFFRKSKSSPFGLEVSDSITREALLLLRSYPHLRNFTGHKWNDDITDEDWAACVPAWPRALSLTFSPTAGRKTIVAAAKLEHVISLYFNSANLTEADLEPLRNHPTLQVLTVLNVETFEYTSYVNQDGDGKWQREE